MSKKSRRAEIVALLFSLLVFVFGGLYLLSLKGEKIPTLPLSPTETPHTASPSGGMKK